jgi:RNA polymerase sigma-70 factor (ECF subfamily)
VTVEGSAQNLDEELVSRAAAGDAVAFSDLVVRHQDHIYGLAVRLLRDPAEAEEVVQEAFLVALEKLSTFRGDAAFGTWLHRVAANAALMRLRKKRRAPDGLVEEPVEELLPRFDGQGHLIVQGPAHDWSKQADEQLADQQIRSAVQRAVQNLPEEYRIVFLLRDVEGFSSEAMAEQLGISVAAVKSRLHRARLALRQKLGQFFE